MSKSSTIQNFKKVFKSTFGENGSVTHIPAEESKDGLETLFVNVSITSEWDADRIDKAILKMIKDLDMVEHFTPADPQTGFGWREITLYGLA
jgi:hypothetical protein